MNQWLDDHYLLYRYGAALRRDPDGGVCVTLEPRNDNGRLLAKRYLVARYRTLFYIRDRGIDSARMADVLDMMRGFDPDND